MEKGISISGMEWYGNRALFEMGGKWFASGLVWSASAPFTMGGFIEPAETEFCSLSQLREMLKEDDEPAWRNENEREAAEEAVLRFYEEGYILPDGWMNNYDDFLCILDGDKFPPMGPYAHMERNPVSVDEMVAFFAPDDDDGWSEDDD